MVVELGFRIPVLPSFGPAVAIGPSPDSPWSPTSCKGNIEEVKCSSIGAADDHSRGAELRMRIRTFGSRGMFCSRCVTFRNGSRDVMLRQLILEAVRGVQNGS